jgi:cellulose 1,4-beta-cellobiosidase
MTRPSASRSPWTSLLLAGSLALPLGCSGSAANDDQTRSGAQGDDADGDGADGDGSDGDSSSSGTTGGSGKPAGKDGSTGSTSASNKDGGTTGSSTKDGGPAKGSDAGTPAGNNPDSKPASPEDTKAAAAVRVDNPFADAKGYVNPEWREKAMAEPGGERIASTPTAVWLDRTAAIEGTTNSMSNGAMGLADHLDAALEQGADYATFVIYNLPGRDCSALASNGELGPDDLPRYKSEYIDPIAAIMGDAKYSKLRIINVIEVDSLPNLVTNTSVEKCAKMKANGGYVQGVSYALNRLGALPNVYNYVDAGHHGWLGWDTNMNPSAELFAETAKMAGFETVHGFITNTANYSALKEPFFDANTSVGGTSVRMAKWVDFNFYVDELSFAQAFRDKLVSLGFDSKIGMLIDTSRNGWGGAGRPTAKSSATDVNMFVDQSRIDRRVHAGNWCNQSGAGLGERPTVSPAQGIDAYVWIKPPGESDGASKMIQNEDGKGFDRMCDPTYGGNERNGNSKTGALADAPLSGAWFSAQFQELMKNAYPTL